MHITILDLFDWIEMLESRDRNSSRENLNVSNYLSIYLHFSTLNGGRHADVKKTAHAHSDAFWIEVRIRC